MTLASSMRCSELFENALACVALLSGAAQMLKLLEDTKELPGASSLCASGFRALFELGSMRSSLLTEAQILLEGQVSYGAQGVQRAVRHLARDAELQQAAVLLDGLCAPW